MWKSIGSETTRAPSGIVKLGLPLNVRVLSVLVWMDDTPADPLLGSAMVTAVMVRSLMPKALLIRRRMWSPPMLVWMVWRIVELKKTELFVPFYITTSD